MVRKRRRNPRARRRLLVQRSAAGAAPLQQVWIAVRVNLRAVLETVTLADLVSGRLPDEVARLAGDPEAWLSR